MKFLRALLIAAAAFVALNDASFAANQTLCAPSSQSGAKRLANPNNSNVYYLNSRGCAVFTSADAAYFQTQGFVAGPELFTFFYTTGVQASGTGDLVIGNIPAGAYIQQIVINETAGAAVTGGIDIGTAANGQQVVAAMTVGASSLLHVLDAALLKRVFSTTVSTPLHLAAHTGWNGANLTLTVIYGYF